MKTALLAIIVLAGSAIAQTTVSPVWNQIGNKKGKASGTFSITNGAVIPATVTVEARSLHFVSGKPSISPLDAGVTVKLNEKSARLHPQEQHDFDYDIRCEQLPCVITFLSGTIVGHTVGTEDKPEMAVRTIVMSTVYICGREKDCRANVLKSGGM